MRGPTNYRGISFTRFHLGFGGRWTLLTGAIVFACVTLFVYGYADRTAAELEHASLQKQPYRSFALYETLSLTSNALHKFQLWRFASSAFLHANLVQLLCSVFLLYLFGAYLVHRLGNLLLLLSFLICAAAGGIATLILSPTEMCLCAPAASLGTSTLCVLHFPYLRFFRWLTARQLLIPAVALMLLSGATFTRQDIVLSGQLASLPAAYLLFRLVPYAQMLISRRRIRREIADLFSEAQKEEELDRILKKVERSGMDSLAQTERRFLRAMSGEYQKRKVKQDT